MSRRLAYLGPPGTFSEQAALLHDSQAQLIPFTSVTAVAAAVDSGMADEGVAAIENSLEGSVNETLDILIHESDLSICRELVLPIEHCLLAAPAASSPDVRVIYSHPQVFGQCRRFLARCFPKAQLEAALSTTAAVEQMLSQQGAAAIATQRAAEIYAAQVLARGIQDNPSNKTRFVILTPHDCPPTGHDKTSIAFTVAHDRPGTLVNVLHEFSDRQINLTKIESRPSKEELGVYIFLVDMDGHRADPAVAEALQRVREQAFFFKVFGSYPRYAPASSS
jgi:prephenate dehydratase